MIDIVERAEKALDMWDDNDSYKRLARELVAALKAARTENERLRDYYDNTGVYIRKPGTLK